MAVQNLQRSLPDLMQCKAKPISSSQGSRKPVENRPGRVTQLHHSHSDRHLPSIEVEGISHTNHIDLKDMPKHVRANLNADLEVINPSRNQHRDFLPKSPLKKSMSHRLLPNVGPQDSTFRWQSSNLQKKAKAQTKWDQIPTKSITFSNCIDSPTVRVTR